MLSDFQIIDAFHDIKNAELITSLSGEGEAIRSDRPQCCEFRCSSQRSAYGQHNFRSWVGPCLIFSHSSPHQNKNQSASNHWIFLESDDLRARIEAWWKCGWRSHLQVAGRGRRLVGKRRRSKCRVGLWTRSCISM